MGSSTWPNLFSSTFATVGEFWRLLQRFLQIAFHSMIVPIPKSQTRHPVRAGAPLPLPHIFFDVTNFYKILPPLPLLVLAPDMLFSCRDWRSRMRRTDRSIDRQATVRQPLFKHDDNRARKTANRGRGY